MERLSGAASSAAEEESLLLALEPLLALASSTATAATPVDFEPVPGEKFGFNIPLLLRNHETLCVCPFAGTSRFSRLRFLALQ